MTAHLAEIDVARDESALCDTVLLQLRCPETWQRAVLLGQHLAGVGTRHHWCASWDGTVGTLGGTSALQSLGGRPCSRGGIGWNKW